MEKAFVTVKGGQGMRMGQVWGEEGTARQKAQPAKSWVQPRNSS